MVKFNERMRDNLIFLENQIFVKETEQKMEEILAKKQKNMIQINITEENYSTTIPIEPTSSVKDIFPILQKKIKVILFFSNFFKSFHSFQFFQIFSIFFKFFSIFFNFC